MFFTMNFSRERLKLSSEICQLIPLRPDNVLLDFLRKMSFNLVLMEDMHGIEVPSYNEKGEVLVVDPEADTFHYVPLSEELVSTYPQLQATYEPMETYDDDGKFKAHWTYEATILLINKYKVYQPKFADSIHKSVQVWDMIATEFRNDGCSFCGTQCENRWKYVKAKYLKKKDNGGPGSTGDELYPFEYYNEMDDILGHKPNVVPKHLASSHSTPKSNKKTTSTVTSKSRSKAPKPIVSTSLHSTSVVGSVASTSNIRRISEDSVLHASSRPSTPNNSFSTNNGPPSPNSLFGFDDVTSEESDPSTEKNTSKGKHRKEPWDENVRRQERYHEEMMQIQRESLQTFKDMMTQMMECFRRN